MKFFKGLVTLVLLIGFVFLPTSVFAQEDGGSIIDSRDLIDETVEVNSFELFWPMVAGKTTGDPLYFLKSLKEKIRGLFIFGAPQKADYAVFLATKRVIEAEKLIKEGEKGLANKSLELAVRQLDKASEKVERAQDKGISFQEEVENMSNHLSNLEIFIPWLILKSEGDKEALTRVLDKVESLNQKF